MLSQQKLMMLLNQPIFYHMYKHDRDMSVQKQQQALKKIYANQKMIRRYKALQQARYMALEDRKVDENIDFLIKHLESIEQQSAIKIMKTQQQKQKLKQKFQERELREVEHKKDMQKVQILAGELKNKTNQLQETRIRVDKIVQRSEVIKALTMSLKVVKQQNQKLLKRDIQQNKQIQKLKNQLKLKNDELKSLKSRMIQK